MRGVRLVHTLRNNPRYLCKYLVWTNILVLLYFVINVDTGHSNMTLSLGPGKVAADEEEIRAVSSDHEKHKFEEFDLSRWKETQHFQLEDSDDQFFT